MKLKNAAPAGMITMNTMVVACIVNSELKTPALTISLSGWVSWALMMSASTQASRKKKNAVTP